MDLRAFHSGDLEILYRIDQACFPPGIAYSRGELSRFIGHRGSKTWVAEEKSEVAGFLIASRQPPSVGHIVTIDVVERWRGRGVGTLMMDAAEKWAHREGVRSIYLETAEDNTAAQRFYAGRGYRKVERIENYYTDGTAAWVMMKGLNKTTNR
jgi:ribosomal-protein-alanine N-acetyltransferase